MSSWCLIAFTINRNDIADIAWGLGFIYVAIIAALRTGTLYEPRMLVYIVLVSIWGLRLSFHIYQRNRNKPEDYRYQQWRRDWGRWFYVRSYLQVFLLQGLFMGIVSLSAISISVSSTKSLSVLDFVAILVWIIGFLFESIADFQLSQFKRDPKNHGKIMQTGLWAYSRHPNYFGETVQWWGLWILTLSTSFYGLALISPVTISYLLIFVSGVPLLEKKYEGRADWDTYKKRVSMFLPLPPRSLR